MKTTAPVKPEKGQSDETSDERKRPPYFPAMLLLAGLIAILFASSDFWKRFYDDPSLDNAEVEAARKEAEEIAKRHEAWVQYVLVADYTAKRPCLRCPFGIPAVTVKTGEIYRYGITTQGESRYTESQYIQLGVTYLEEFRGSYSECKKMEVNKILAYRFLPQSNKLEAKLIRPPGNANKN
ncbi:MAG: hypothetical protein GVY26_18455 [Bacteroidetes bacterium]|jgi:hypothetical protein|nr:hypothetical protein [Bacteroidota bacterium]